MIPFVALFLIAGLLTSVSGKVTFINPAPFGKRMDFSNSETYKTGSLVNIAWTPADEGRGVSVVLWQLNSTTGAWYGDMEYLTQGAVGVVRYSWLVGTRKNLSDSNLFYLSLFQEGTGPSDSNSHYFYIKRDSNAEATSTNSSPTSTTTKNTSLTATSTLTTSTTNKSPISTSSSNSSLSPPTSSSLNFRESPSSSTPDTFPTTAKIGIGVGIPVALILGLVAGYVIFRRRNNQGGLHILDTPAVEYQPNNTSSHYGSNLNEAPTKSPVEVASVDSQSVYSFQNDRGRDGRKTVRYELS